MKAVEQNSLIDELEREFRNEEFLLYRLPAVSRRISHICASEYLAEFGLKVPEWRLLAQLSRFGGISAKEVSDKILMDQVSISRAVRKCVTRGMIKEVPDPHDRRSKKLVLTAAGKAFIRRFLPRACDLAARMESGLSTTEIRTLKRLLKKLDRHLLTIMPGANSGEDFAG